MSQDCLVAFGSNLGDSDSIYSAICSIWKADSRFDSVVASSLITTKPVGSDSDQNNYRNGCFRFRFSETVDELFQTLIGVEQDFGRVRRERWGARTVDLDLLLFGDQQTTAHSLLIPHPRLSFRRFVLQPAAEIAAEMNHPDSGLTIQQHLELLDSRPDRIALVTTDPAGGESSVQQSISQFEDQGWEFQFFSTVQQIRCREEEFKLLVYSRDLPAELLAAARSFRGATLDASADDGPLDLLELAAAIDAMGPF